MTTTSTPAINLTNSVLDVQSIVDNLIYADSGPVRTMQSQVTTLQSEVSAYQSLNTKLSALSDKVNTVLFGSTQTPLITPYTFSDRLSNSIFAQCGVTSSDDAIVSATASNPPAGGSYSIAVSSLAQAQTMVSLGFSSATSAAIGTGTITITPGSGNPVTVTVNSSNNTLSGLRDAINNLNAGVTATIINDGSATPYKLMITANDTGTANSFTVNDNLSGGQALGFTQTQAATDAQFVVNGTSITKSTNSVSDVISGLTFTLKKLTDSPVTLSIGRNVDSIVSALNDFVSAYNSVSSFINSQFTYDTTTKKAGVLSGDATLRQIQSALQNQFTQLISNRFSSYGVTSQVGLQFNRDGSLSLDETKLRNALSNNFTSVAALFLGDGTPMGGATSSDSRVTYNGKTSATQPGTYSVQIDGLAQQASVLGDQTITSLSDNETLTISSGNGSAIVSLLQNDSLSAVLSKINNALSGQGMAVTATDDGTGKIKIATNNYGSAQTITVVSDRDSASGTTGFGTSPMIASGVDITGTINGHEAIGSGLMLTGASGQPEEGLSLNISQTVAGNYGSITVASATQGVEGASILMNLFSALDGITDPLSGPMHNAMDGVNKSISNINDEISSYQDRLAQERELLTSQYNQADQALRLLSVTQASLTSQLSSLSNSS